MAKVRFARASWASGRPLGWRHCTAGFWNARPSIVKRLFRAADIVGFLSRLLHPLSTLAGVLHTAILSVNDLNMYAGIRIGGAPGASYRIDARNSLNTNDTWLTLTNFALPYSPFLFIDEDSPNHPQRFYQVTSP